MTSTNHLFIYLVLMAGLTSSCGPGAVTADDRAENSGTMKAVPDNIAAIDMPERDTVVVTPAAVEAGIVASASAQDEKAVIQSLPLRPGQYVNSEAPCNQAGSWARVALVSRTGMNLNCAFKKIEKTGPTTYQVTSECSDGGAAWGREQGVETSTAIYEIPNETSFKVTYEGGSEVSARYCAQVGDP